MKTSISVQKLQGYSLIEILVSIAIVMILATLTIVAVNPSKILSKGRDTKRQADLVLLHDALYQWQLDGGDINLIKQGDGSDLDLCTLTANRILTSSGVTLTGTVDLYSFLVDGDTSYLDELPQDPHAPDGETGYFICDRGTTQKSVMLIASLAESGTAISVPVQDTNSPAEVITITPNYIVNTTDDVTDGTCDSTHCSLREAINAANTKPNNLIADLIHFDISGTGPFKITATSALPFITEELIIDGTSQPGSSCNDLNDGNGHNIQIQIDGAGLPVGNSGLVISGENSIVKGLSITNFTGYGIYILTNGGQTIECNYLGTAPGSTATTNGNNRAAIYILDVPDVTIHSNLISNNISEGIYLRNAGTDNIVITSNYIGTDYTGFLDNGNAKDGIFMYTSDSLFSENIVIGGSLDNRNVISGNNRSGIAVFGAFQNMEVSNNIIGLDADSLSAVANTQNGITITGIATSYRNPNNIEINYNVISGNTGNGIAIQEGQDNIISNNKIGVDGLGVASVPNSGSGIYLWNNTNYNKGNLIIQNIIKNNLRGIQLYQVGGGSSNQFKSNKITQNNISDNIQLPIDIYITTVATSSGVTPNDGLEDTSYPNLAIDYPIISSANISSGKVNVLGYIGNVSGQTKYSGGVVEIFLRPEFEDSSQDGEIIAGDMMSVGHGEAQRFIGACTVDADGTFGTITACQLVIPPGLTIASGDYINGTFTDTADNTSEFGANFGL